MNHIENHCLDHKAGLQEALEKLNRIPESLTLFIRNDDGQVIGTLTDGDIRRGFLKGYDLNTPLEKFCYRDFKYLREGEFERKEIRRIREMKLKLVPLVDKNLRIIRLYNFHRMRSLLPVDAVLMAGGKGTRLQPLTGNTPKPLLKVGQRPVIQHNIEHLSRFGIDRFHITLNYLGELIEKFLEDFSAKPADFNFIYEDKPLGTIGSVKLIREFKNDHVLIMNADLLTDLDYDDMYSEFLDTGADMLVASKPFTFSIPYAILETRENRILEYREKPNYTYNANAGIYIIKKELIGLVPENTEFHATDLIEKVIHSGKKIYHYSIRSYWLDIGNHEDYEKAQKDIAHLNLT